MQAWRGFQPITYSIIEMPRLKILIIDDEVDYCQIMKTYFTEKDHEVLMAYTLKEGLALITSNTPDILFLDNNLPDGQGWESVDEIVEKFPRTRIYLVSAYRQKSDFHRTHSNITVWEKPISLIDLDSVDQDLQNDNM